MRGLNCLAAALAGVVLFTGCGDGGPSQAEQTATTAAISAALDQIGAAGGDQITEVSVLLRGTEPIVSALVASPDQSQRVTVNRDGLASEPRGSLVGSSRPATDWQDTDFVGFAAGLKCAEPILVTATASQAGALMVAECADAALKVELDGTALPKLSDYAAEQTWQSLLGEAASMVDLTRVTQVALWGGGSLDGRPWFMINGLAIGSAGTECEMQWSRKPDPLDAADHTIAPASLAGCTGINSNAVTFDLTKVPAADFAAAVAAAADEVGKQPQDAMVFNTEVVDGRLVLGASWGVGDAGKAQIVLAERAP